MVDRIKFEREKIASAGTANRYLALIRSILRRACGEWEWIDRVPKFNLFREAEGRVRSPSPQELQRLHQELPEHLADMALFSIATGLRQANVRDLEWQYVDLDRMHLWIPGSKHKNGKPHSVPLNEMAMSVLRKLHGRLEDRRHGGTLRARGTRGPAGCGRAAGCDDRLRCGYARSETRKTNGLTFPPGR